MGVRTKQADSAGFAASSDDSVPYAVAPGSPLGQAAVAGVVLVPLDHPLTAHLHNEPVHNLPDSVKGQGGQDQPLEARLLELLLLLLLLMLPVPEDAEQAEDREGGILQCGCWQRSILEGKHCQSRQEMYQHTAHQRNRSSCRAMHHG